MGWPDMPDARTSDHIRGKSTGGGQAGALSVGPVWSCRCQWINPDETPRCGRCLSLRSISLSREDRNSEEWKWYREASIIIGQTREALLRYLQRDGDHMEVFLIIFDNWKSIDPFFERIALFGPSAVPLLHYLAIEHGRPDLAWRILEIRECKELCFFASTGTDGNDLLSSIQLAIPCFRDVVTQAIGTTKLPENVEYPAGVFGPLRTLSSTNARTRPQRRPSGIKDQIDYASSYSTWLDFIHSVLIEAHLNSNAAKSSSSSADAKVNPTKDAKDTKKEQKTDPIARHSETTALAAARTAVGPNPNEGASNVDVSATSIGPISQPIVPTAAARAGMPELSARPPTAAITGTDTGATAPTHPEKSVIAPPGMDIRAAVEALTLKWSCSLCTCDNVMTSTNCEACSAQRILPTSSAPNASSSALSSPPAAIRSRSPDHPLSVLQKFLGFAELHDVNANPSQSRTPLPSPTGSPLHLFRALSIDSATAQLKRTLSSDSDGSENMTTPPANTPPDFVIPPPGYVLCPQCCVAAMPFSEMAIHTSTAHPVLKTKDDEVLSPSTRTQQWHY